MANSADPDQLASSEANWSGSTLFAKAGHIQAQQDQGYTTITHVLLRAFWQNFLCTTTPWWYNRTEQNIIKNRMEWNGYEMFIEWMEWFLLHYYAFGRV